MARATHVVVVLIGSTIGLADCCLAETPLMSVLIKAHGNTKFSTLLPIMDRLNAQGRVRVTYELNDKPGVSIIIRIRSDARVLDRTEAAKALRREPRVGEPRVVYLGKEGIDRMKTDLRKLGADSVAIETVNVLPTSEFSIDAVKELRSQNRRIIIICHAEWDVPSARLEKSLLLNDEVIAAAKTSRTVVMLVDMTHRLGEENTEFFRKLGASPLSFMYFGPGKNDPVVTKRVMRPSEFIKLLRSEE